MNAIVSLLGSPSAQSRSARLLTEIEGRLARALGAQFSLSRITLRDLPARPLLHGRADEGAVAAAVAAVRDARVLLVATPIYKAAYSGLLKTFLDLLPQDALRGKTVVPLATGGSAAHLLALDYAIKPVLGTLGARDIRDAIYATEAELPVEGSEHAVSPELLARIDRVVTDLLPLWPGRLSPVAARPLQAVSPVPVPALRITSLAQPRCSP